MITILLSFFINKPSKKEGNNKFRADSFECPPSRKSLVKGERFIRSEGRPELVASADQLQLYTACGIELCVGFVSV